MTRNPFEENDQLRREAASRIPYQQLYGVGIACPLLVIAFVFRNAVILPWVCLSVALIEMVVFYSWKDSQLVIIRYWRLITAPIRWLAVHLVLGAVYFLVLTPMAVALRLLGFPAAQRKSVGGWRDGKQIEEERLFRQY